MSGLMRDVAMAFAFGTNPSVAAFLLSYRLAHLLRRVLGEGCLQQAFIPIFEKIRTESGEDSAYAFYELVQKRLLQGLIPLIALSSFVLWGWRSDEVPFLTLLMLPSLLFITLFGLNASILQANRSFFLPACAPVVFNFLWTGGALSFQFWPAEQAMPFMALILNVGCLFQWALTLPFMEKRKGEKTPSPLPFSTLLSRVGLGLLGVSATQINNAIDPIFARFSDASGPAYLWYAIRVEQFPLSLFSIALSSALLPPLARAVARNNLSLSSHFFETALRRATGLLLPMTGYMLLVSTSLIALLFGWGEFGTTSINKTAYCLSAYALALVPSTWVLILANLHFAFGNFKKTAKASLVTLLANMILNPLFLFGFGMGVEGVAFATALATTVNALMLMRALPFSLPPAIPLLRVGSATLLAYLATQLIPLNSGSILFHIFGTGLVFVSFLALFGRLLQAEDLLFWKNAPEPLLKK
jgi:putative peptidoglycan lipid II flippase